MADATTTVAVLKDAVHRFAAERAWEPFHTPKNLAMGTAIEAAELMEHFLWVDGPASVQMAKDPKKREGIIDEVADIAVYVLNLANVLGVDLGDAILAKIAKNALKYPVKKYKGRFER